MPNSLISAFWGGVILLIAGGLDWMTSEGPFQHKLSYGSPDHSSDLAVPALPGVRVVQLPFQGLFSLSPSAEAKSCRQSLLPPPHRSLEQARQCSAGSSCQSTDRPSQVGFGMCCCLEAALGSQGCGEPYGCRTQATVEGRLPRRCKSQVQSWLCWFSPHFMHFSLQTQGRIPSASGFYFFFHSGVGAVLGETQAGCRRLWGKPVFCLFQSRSWVPLPSPFLGGWTPSCPQVTSVPLSVRLGASGLPYVKGDFA